ncbi:MAG TPA: hypothetical protein DEA55_10365 [Rhodospirillaceae bacterium]|nr:hypothetical protein [Rhodospirillaceae bacterium]
MRSIKPGTHEYDWRRVPACASRIWEWVRVLYETCALLHAKFANAPSSFSRETPYKSRLFV